MCGLAGFISVSPKDFELQDLGASYCEALGHRGPDDSGVWEITNDHHQVLLAQTRLSILDLSTAGHQPYIFNGGNQILVFNGEIYNFIELKSELVQLGHKFHSSSDTEVLAAAWVQWGQKALSKFDGMFAIGIYDKVSKTLFLARDPFGIKPLYFSSSQGSFSFGSSPEVLVKAGLVEPKANPRAIFDYLAWGQYDIHPETFFRNVFRVPSGGFMKVLVEKGKINVESGRWWKPESHPITQDSKETAAIKIRQLFIDSVAIQMRSDAPLGFALSGGVDSSAIVCVARHLNPEAKLACFAYFADDPKLSEQKWVELVAEHVSAELEVIEFPDSAISDEIEGMSLAQAEPFSSSRIFAQYKVFERAKKSGIKVMLEGQGGDELFAGYQGFAHLRVISLLETGQFVRLLRFIRKWSEWPGRSRFSLLGQSLAYIFRLNSWPVGLQLFLRSLILKERPSEALNSKEFKRDGSWSRSAHTHRLKREFRGRRVVEGLIDALQDSYLPQLMRQGDRNAMAHSVENRVPFLGVELVRYVLTLPDEYLISDEGETKSVFKLAMRGIVPDEILDRKDKIGFETPQNRLWNSPKLISLAGMGLGSQLSVARKDPGTFQGKALKWRYLNVGLWLAQLEKLRK